MACLLCCFIVLFANLPTYSQNSNCSNLGFEFGNFTNWIGETWIYSSSQPSSNTPRVTGFATRRHTIMSDTSARDANTGYALRTIPSGYKYSARLGDGFTSADARFRCWDQSLRYTMTIDSSNALLVMKFACVIKMEVMRGKEEGDIGPEWRDINLVVVLNLHGQNNERLHKQTPRHS